MKNENTKATQAKQTQSNTAPAPDQGATKRPKGDLRDKEVEDIMRRTRAVWQNPSWESLIPWERAHVLNYMGSLIDKHGPEIMTDEKIEEIKDIFLLEWTGEFHPYSIGSA